MKLGTAIFIIFAVQMVLWPLDLWLTIFQRLTFVAAVIAVLYFPWFKPMQDREAIPIWQENIATLEPECAEQRRLYGDKKPPWPDLDRCKSLQGNNDALAEAQKGAWW
jgi:hypothetical protein